MAEFTENMENETEAAKTADEIKTESESGDAGIDVSQFPAIRQAYAFASASDGDSAEGEGTRDDEREEDVFFIMQRLAEQEVDDNEALETADREENIPEIFVNPPAPAVSMEPDWNSTKPEENVTLEEVNDRGSRIAGELMSYIELLEMDAADAELQREANSGAVRKKTPDDPYNVKFNSAGDDTEEVLANTYEISLEPKYSIE